MKISYHHLLNFLVDKPSIEEISDKLFQLGHEHEIENSIFNMEFTPNRGDCLSLIGLARDLNIFYKTNLDLAIYDQDISYLELNFINKSKTECPKISFLNIEIEGEIADYKGYLSDYFKDLNINKNNLFADISNYIAYELGQPTHSYDYSHIDGDLTLQKNKDDCKFKTLLGNDITLKSSDLVFSNQGNIINLAGIIGGDDTACSKKTVNALVECAYFVPEAIIGKAIKYDIHSDASHKFERGVDPNCHEKVLRRFIKIVSDHAKIKKLELHTYSDSDFLKNVKLDVDVLKINKILGTNISEENYVKSLTKLGFKISKYILAPSYRSDIYNQNDLAEEIARVIGYNNIPVKNFNLLPASNSSQDYLIRSFLVDNGFSEVINSSFCGLNSDNSIKVDNPLDSGRQYIRTNITNSLIENVIYNEKRQKDSIKFFEISDIYTSDQSISKEKRLAIIVSGRKDHNHQDFSQKLDEKYLKSLFKEININIDGLVKIADRANIDSKIKTPIYSLEINIKGIYKKFEGYKIRNNTENKFVEYQPISEFPSSYRDFSFSIQDQSQINKVIQSLELSKTKFLKNFYMFDFYQNKETKLTKIGYRFIFQARSKTLTDKDIDESIEKILAPIISLDSVKIPGIS